MSIFKPISKSDAHAMKQEAIMILNRDPEDHSYEARDERMIAQAMLDAAIKYLSRADHRNRRPAHTVRPKPGVTNWDGGSQIAYKRSANNMHTKLISMIRDDRRDQEDQAS